MNMAYALYALEASDSLSVASSGLIREGALLKIIFDSGRVGFADCHPWPEMGDLPLKEQLSRLAQGKFTPVTRCALELASLDAGYRSTGKSAFMHQNIPRSHFLVTNISHWGPQDVQQIIQQGYTHVKLKMGRNIDREVESIYSLFLNTSLQLRLDFNEILEVDAFHDFLQRIQTIKEQIDFIEDPFPFDESKWTAIQKEGWRLACDRQAKAACHRIEAARILIVKPALQSFEEWRKWGGQTLIVTSYLGHPLGQMAAAYVASQVDSSCSLVHGLLSHHAYQPTCFSQHLNWQNPSFFLPPGAGFGFDGELDQLEWVRLA